MTSPITPHEMVIRIRQCLLNVLTVTVMDPVPEDRLDRIIARSRRDMATLLGTWGLPCPAWVATPADQIPEAVIQEAWDRIGDVVPLDGTPRDALATDLAWALLAVEVAVWSRDRDVVSEANNHAYNVIQYLAEHAGVPALPPAAARAAMQAGLQGQNMRTYRMPLGVDGLSRAG